MSPPGGPLRPARPEPYEDIARWFAHRSEGLDPDPLFRRRLRGAIVNGYVADREGRRGAGPRRMGRLGRACLYASVCVAASVSSVMALSDQALPGDLLYPLKRQIETLRFQVLPAHLHDDLEVAVLTERIDEMRRLADAGEWTALSGVADELVLLDPMGGKVDAAHLVVLEGLIHELPAQARATVDDVIYATVSGGVGDAPVTPSGSDDEPEDDGSDASADVREAPTPSPTPSPSPTPTASPSPTQSPTATPSPTPSPSPTPTPTSDDDD